MDSVWGYPGSTSLGRKRRNDLDHVRGIGTSRTRYWLHALIVGLALTGEIHLFLVELLHHHIEVASLCRVEHGIKAHLHSGGEAAPLCPLCQMVRAGSVCPVAQNIFQKPHLETPYRLVSRNAKYCYRFAVTLPARAPPNA
jgi:hypothetical protein